MKQFCVFILTLVFAVSALWTEETLKTENMTSFMGMRWGVTKASYEKNFKVNFKAKRKEFKKILDLRSMEVFKSPVSLVFADPHTNGHAAGEGSKKSSKENLLFSEANIIINPAQFEDLLDVLKYRYGDPTSFDENQFQNHYGATLTQRTACWDHPQIGRSIIIRKFGSFLDRGEIQFTRYKTEEEKQREEERLVKEREERLRKAAALL